MTIKIYEINTPKYLGELTEIQLDFIKTILETKDKDKMVFHLDQDSLDYLKEWVNEPDWKDKSQEITSFITILEKSLGNKPAVDIVYEKFDTTLPYKIIGNIVERKSSSGTFAAKVKGFIEFGSRKELLGIVLTDEKGNFSIYHDTDLKSLGSGVNIQVIVEKWSGNKFDEVADLKTREFTDKLVNMQTIRI